ncbi:MULTISPECIES: class F sortase [unclassified Streptomyces]|uniref:class F sortase n=1 Tax=unclassified Streptomyces TaxID=2593676 RepID=UPI0005F90C77|nr:MULTISPECIES: class F sortase [unclassified Streptomyces]KJY32776.1 peptidase C60 [Streptomyces sp. NRRL S-495]KOV12656.1 peptidase C60 [Streptomyces sp. XY431]
MPRPDRPPRARRGGPGPLTAGAVAVALAAGGTWLVRDGSDGGGPPLPPAPSDRTPAASAPVRTPAPVPAAPPLAASEPTRIRIPAIKVDAPMTGVGLTAARTLATPPMEQRNLAAWYRDGTAPGAAGNAVVVGHADNRNGPAVFYRLGLLRPGDTVDVTRKDRRTAVFTVDSVKVFPKRDFPDALVYGDTDRAELRVITCGGKFDRRTGGYESNTVVFAHLTSVR